MKVSDCHTRLRSFLFQVFRTYWHSLTLLGKAVPYFIMPRPPRPPSQLVANAPRADSDPRNRKTKITSVPRHKNAVAVSKINSFNNSLGSKQHASFNLPLLAKAIMTLALFAAAVSISRVEKAVRSYNAQVSSRKHSKSRERALRSKSVHGRPSFQVTIQNHAYRPRVVFFDSALLIPVAGNGDSYNSTAMVNNGLQPAIVFSIVMPRATLVVSTAAMDDEKMDETRYYHIGDSRDFPKMERRHWPVHDFDPHCVPSAKWQSTFYPVCNDIHAETDVRQALIDADLSLLSSKGFWRHAWRHQVGRENGTKTNQTSTTVWKTFK